MRPTGGKYPGISADFDRSMDNVYEDPEPVDSEVPPYLGDIPGERFSTGPISSTKTESGSPTTDEQPATHDVWIYLDDRHCQHKKTIMRIDIESTWIFDDEIFLWLQTQLWDKVKNPGEPLQSRIPTYGMMPTALFPYNTLGWQDIPFKVSHFAGQLTLAVAQADQRLPCTLCNKLIAGSDRQNHMGRHIAFYMLCAEDKTVAEGQVKWSYNMLNHMETCHPGWEPQVTSEYRNQMGVSKVEQDAFGLVTTSATTTEVVNSKRTAPSPPGSPRLKAIKEQRKFRRLGEGSTIELSWDED
ncbi:hypothetical protein H0H81_004716, partial [Sphagnurus paluster]